MHWILQNNLFNEAAYQTLLDTLETFGYPYSIHKVVPFIGELMPVPELDEDNVICMGSYSMRHAAVKHGWTPGVFDLEPYDFTVQMQHWGEYMLNFDSVVCPFEDANFTDDLMFIRPIHDSKVFAGKVFSKGEFYDWKRKVVVLEEDHGTSLTRSTLIQLSVPKVIWSEYRFWVVNGSIVTASMYKRGTQVIYQELSSSYDQAYFEFVRARIKEWQPDQAFVIDIADTPDGIKVVEINTLNSCGFYAANIPRLVNSLVDAFDVSLSQSPAPGTKRYIQIVADGCGGHYDYFGEFDCSHGYTWIHMEL